MKLGFTTGKKDSKTGKSSDFSVFLRSASSGQKKKVFMEVARKASDDQRKFLSA